MVEDSFAVIPLWENCVFPRIISSWQWSIGMWVVKGCRVLTAIVLRICRERRYTFSRLLWRTSCCRSAGGCLPSALRSQGRCPTGKWQQDQRDRWHLATRGGATRGVCKWRHSLCRSLESSLKRVWRTGRSSLWLEYIPLSERVMRK